VLHFSFLAGGSILVSTGGSLLASAEAVDRVSTGSAIDAGSRGAGIQRTDGSGIDSAVASSDGQHCGF